MVDWQCGILLVPSVLKESLFIGEQHHSTRQEMVRISTKNHQLKLKNNSVGPGAGTHNTNESAGGRFSVKLVASFSELPGYAIHFCFTNNLVGHHQKKDLNRKHGVTDM